MSKQQYAWMLGLVVAWRQFSRQGDADLGEPLSLAMKEITGVAGRLHRHDRQSANDLAAILLALMFIWYWNSVKYRANFGGIHRNRANYLQNVDPVFLSHDPAETRTIPALPEISGFFWTPIPLCQMNSTLTVNCLVES